MEEDGYEKEYNTLKDGFDSKYREVYDEISKIVRGGSLPVISEQDKTKYGISGETDEEQGILDFWSVALKNSAYFPTNEKDEEVLKHLKDIRMKLLEGSRLNFVVEFEFNQNDNFTPNILTKTYFFEQETEEVEKTTGSSIQWASQDKNPRVEVKTKKVKKGKTVETKKVESLVPSFFDIFADTSKDDPQANEEANFWKDDFFANSLEYYLNIIDTDFFGEGEDFEDDEDEEDEDDDDEKPKKSKKFKNPAAGDSKEKCKNQ